MLKTELWLSDFRPSSAQGEPTSTQRSRRSSPVRPGGPALRDSIRARSTCSRCPTPDRCPLLAHPHRGRADEMHWPASTHREDAGLPQIGLSAFDARLHAVSAPVPTATPAARPADDRRRRAQGLGDITMGEEYKVLAFRHFESLVDRCSPTCSGIQRAARLGRRAADLVIQTPRNAPPRIAAPRPAPRPLPKRKPRPTPRVVAMEVAVLRVPSVRSTRPWSTT